jgi:hypothetical protein
MLMTPMLASLAAFTTAALAAPSPRDFSARLTPGEIIKIGHSGTCPAVPTVTVEVQPVYYCRAFASPAIIFPFRDGHPITISAVSTTVIITSIITEIFIYPSNTCSSKLNK